jgi:hypothetical protein
MTIFGGGGRCSGTDMSTMSKPSSCIAELRHGVAKGVQAAKADLGESDRASLTTQACMRSLTRG